MKIIFSNLVFTSLVLLSLGISEVYSQNLSPEKLAEETAQILGQLWSPYCKGISLLECPSDQAQEVRDHVIGKLKLGTPKLEIIDELHKKYGDQLRMTPATKGRESLAFSLPWILFTLTISIFLLWVYFRRHKRILPTTETALKNSAQKSSQVRNEILKDLDQSLR